MFRVVKAEGGFVVLRQASGDVIARVQEAEDGDRDHRTVDVVGAVTVAELSSILAVVQGITEVSL